LLASEVHHSSCTCAIGSGGCCGHIIGLLYQLAEYKTLGLTSVPDPVPCTSLPQQWHKPRGKKIGSVRVEDMQLSAPTVGVVQSRAVCSNLYNPISDGNCPEISTLKAALIDVNYACQWMQLDCPQDKLGMTKFGSRVKGSVLSYQQCEHSTIKLNFPDIDFPTLPISNSMCPITTVLTEYQTIRISELSVTVQQSFQFEQKTRLQSDTDEWFHLRKSRLTASKIGMVCKRRGEFSKLSSQLHQSVRATAAMKLGSLMEPHAADMYAQVNSLSKFITCNWVIFSNVSRYLM
jgi:hypothetical protein